jgi:hypothetical protein
MRINDPLFLENVIGMPTWHALAFLETARRQRCVIIVRATGPTCHGLLLEGYDTKGYRIHGKSCDWGPMAGFVLRDPHLNKSGMARVGYNRDKHREAIDLDAEHQGWNASVTPLVISEARRQWLVARGYINVQLKGGRYDGRATHRSGIAFYYSLIPNQLQPGLWDVYFDNSRHGEKWIQEKGGAVVKYHPRFGPAYEPMLALTNPATHRLHSEDHYKNAVTGDYDLFAVWPLARKYNPRGDDHRPLGTVRGSVGRGERDNVDALERDFTHMGWGTKLGNITYRIQLVCQMVNSIIGRANVLWHSDESARPFLDDVDLPVMAFTPAGDTWGIETIPQFKSFIDNCNHHDFAVTLSNAWTQAPTPAFPQRLGGAYARYVPPDASFGGRALVPDYVNW